MKKQKLAVAAKITKISMKKKKIKQQINKPPEKQVHHYVKSLF